MTLGLKVVDNKAIINVNGRLDIEGSPIFHQAIIDLPSNIATLVINLENTEYISSAGLRELLICAKKYGNDNVEVINVNELVDNIIQICGFSAFIKYSKYEDKSKLIKLSFADFLHEKARLNSDTNALYSDVGGYYTWEDLDMASQIMANDLVKLGVKPGSRVGLCSQNSINYMIAFFAIQKLGAFTQLINNQLKVGDLISVLKSGDVEYLCYGDLFNDGEAFINSLKEEYQALKGYYSISENINLKTRFSEYGQIKNMNLPHVDSDQPAIMIFTSGSSGTPKGVLLSSYNILNAANNNGEYLNITSNDKLCLILPLFHIFGIVPCFFAHAINNSVVMLPQNIKTQYLLDFISSNKCTHFNTVPTMMLAIINNKSFSSEILSSLKCTMLAGASATEAQLIMFKKLLPNNHFLTAYGLSEIAPVTITNFDDTIYHLTKTVGHPLAGIQIKIVDPQTNKEVSQGQDGEILVQGFNLMVGYYKVNPQDQSIDIDGYLHTGDIGHFDKDGYLVFSSRLKELIIRGGENIVPSEIANAISQYDKIADVRIFGIPDDFFGEIVGACLVMKENETFDEIALNSFLSDKIAKFKIPAKYMVYESFPLLSNGKIDLVTLKKDFLSKVSQ